MKEDLTFLSRQAILNAEQEVKGFEFTFLENEEASSEMNQHDIETGSRVLFEMMSSFGMEKVLNNKKAFINVDTYIIQSPIIPGLDKNRFVFEIPAYPPISDPLTVDRIALLKSNGYQFSLDAFSLDDKTFKANELILPLMDYIKIDISKNDHSILRLKMNLLRKYPAALIAYKISTQQDLSFCLSVKFDLYQGQYMLKPRIIKGKSVAPEYIAIVDILKYLQEDAKVDAIVSKFEEYPDLTLNMLRFINSASIYTRSRISSIRQAVALMGSKRLIQWMFLMLYAKTGVPRDSNYLYLTAGKRARMMERILEFSDKDADQETQELVLFVGMLSIVDVLFQMPMEKIVEELNLDETICAALLRFEGIAGKILHFVLMSEELGQQEIQQMLEDMHITRKQYFEILADSYSHSGL